MRDLPQRVRIGAAGWAELEYELKPLARGELEFGPIEMRVALAARAVGAARRGPARGATIRVYPNFAALSKYALLATDQRLSQIGVLQRPRRGEGLEFHQLREYREGDMQRQIDWKATSRAGKLISREYQDERDQQIMFLIDCGRRLARARRRALAFRPRAERRAAARVRERAPGRRGGLPHDERPRALHGAAQVRARP